MKIKILKKHLMIICKFVIITAIILLFIYNVYELININKIIANINDKSLYAYQEIDYTEMESNANTMDEINSLKEKNKPLIVVFGSNSCHDCNDYMPSIKELYNKYHNIITIKCIDTSKNRDILEPYNIFTIPTTIFFNVNGNPYKPSKNIVIEDLEENENGTIDEGENDTKEIKLVTGNDLNLNNNFKYGQDKLGNILYTSYEGVIKMTELENIIKDLLKNST